MGASILGHVDKSGEGLLQRAVEFVQEHTMAVLVFMAILIIYCVMAGAQIHYGITTPLTGIALGKKGNSNLRNRGRPAKSAKKSVTFDNDDQDAADSDSPDDASDTSVAEEVDDLISALNN